MKEFTLVAMVTVSTYTVIEAETKEEAIKIAEGRTIDMGRGWSNAEQAKEEWVVEEIDGEPCDIRCEDEA